MTGNANWLMALTDLHRRRVALIWLVLVVLLAVAAVTTSAHDYNRKDWKHWTDADKDCQDTRDEVLIAESVGPVTLDAKGCNVVAGLWHDPYTGLTFTDPKQLDIDHRVALGNAFRTGGFAWDKQTRERYANDMSNPEHLVAVQASANRQKSDKAPDEWRPPDTENWCAYARHWIGVKTEWKLMFTLDELTALVEMTDTCPIS